MDNNVNKNKAKTNSKSSLKMWALICMIGGGVLLLLGIVCFIGLAVLLGSAGMTVSSFRYSLSMAEGLMGGDISSMLGVPSIVVIMIKFAMNMRYPLVILGILAIIAGVVLFIMDRDPNAVNKAKDGLSRGVSSASALVKDTIDKATVKCPKCGKVCPSKTAFCPACGEKMPLPAPKPESSVGVKCPNCGKGYARQIAFCPQCGTKMPAPRPAFIICPGCGTKNPGDSRFCCECGTKLADQ